MDIYYTLTIRVPDEIDPDIMEQIEDEASGHDDTLEKKIQRTLGGILGCGEDEISGRLPDDWEAKISEGVPGTPFDDAPSNARAVEALLPYLNRAANGGETVSVGVHRLPGIVAASKLAGEVGSEKIEVVGLSMEGGGYADTVIKADVGRLQVSLFPNRNADDDTAGTPDHNRKIEVQS